MAIPRLAITSWVIRRREIYAASLSILLSLSTGLAQERPATVSNPSAITITASATANQVRFAAPSSVVQLRLEVYDSSGRKLFDNELRGGNVLDWHLLNGQAEQLADDTYLCVVTIKSLSGKITQRIGSVKIDQRTAKLQATTTGQMTAHQLEAIGPVEENAILTILEPDPQQTTTLVAHNGEDGQITRGRGALSFRLGDFYSGKDSEQMRLTQEGNLGIGISQPQARLDVDGFVRATQGIVFPDGSIQFSASRKTFGPPSQRRGLFQQTSATGQEHLLPDISGTGTTDKLAKWIDGPNGVLGDSLITEANNNIGINTTPDPRFKLDVLGFNRFRAPNASFYLSGFKPGGNDWVYQTVDDDGRFRIWGGTNTTGAERLTIKLDTGNVGIGNPNPTGFRLDVVGGVRSFNTVSTHFVAETTGGTNAWARFYMKSPSQSWFIGTSQNFNGNQLYLNDETSNQTRMGIQPNGGEVSFSSFIGGGHLLMGEAGCGPGYAGIGFGATLANCVNYSLIGNGTHTLLSRPAGGGLFFREANNDQMMIAAGGSVGIGTTVPGAKLTIIGTGSNGFSLGTSGNVGTGGNAIQAREKGGWVKAMVYVNGDGTILRCYNGTTGESLTGGTTNMGCGFTAGRAETFFSGYYFINFGFQISDRFYSVSVNTGCCNGPSIVNFYPSDVDSAKLTITVHNTSSGLTDRPVMVIVY